MPKSKNRIRKKIKQIFKRNIGYLICSLVILTLFFGLRLINLKGLPVFADEAIYLRWAQVMRSEPTLRFLPLSDGKQPLYMWLVMVGLRLITDPILCGRLVSVLSGFGSLVGLSFLTWFLFKDKKIVMVVAFLYTILPFYVFFDRIGLVDSLLLMLSIWFYLLAVLLASKLRTDLAMTAGIILGLALVTKSPALFSALLLPTTIIFVKGFFKKKTKTKFILSFGKLVLLWGIVYLFGLGIYNLLRLGPGFEQIAMRNKDYIFPIKEVLTHPWDPLKPHLGDLKIWLPNLLTWPVIIFLLWEIIRVFFGKERKFLVGWLLLVSLGPMLAQSSIARVFTPRYLLFATWPLVVLAASGIAHLPKKFLTRIGLGVIFCWAFVYDQKLLFKIQEAPLPQRMRTGYLQEWTSGYGIAETALYLEARLLEIDEPILVGTEGYFGTLPDGLWLYFNHSPRLNIIGVGQPIREVSPSLLEARKENEVYLLVNQSRMLVGNDQHLELVKKFPKAAGLNGQDFLLLYRLLDEDEIKG
ncbi:ArnT family glycosyltransferase [Patescibacteria group bacterium]